MWQLSKIFGVATLATAVGSIVTLAFVFVLRRQQIQLIRLGYYKRKSRLLKPVHGQQWVGIVCLSSVLMGYWSPNFGFLSLGFGLGVLFLGGRLAHYWERWEQGEGMVTYLTGLEGLIQGGVSFPVALQKLSSGPTRTQTRVRRAIHQFALGSTFSGVIGSFTEYVQMAERAYQLGLPMLPLVSAMRGAFEARTHREKRVFQIRAQALTHGLIAALLPWVVFFFLWFQQPHWVMSIVKKPSFLWALGIAFLLQSLGIGVILKISRFPDGVTQRLLEFVHSLQLFVRSGFSLHWSWHSLSQKNKSGWEGWAPQENESMDQCLERLSLTLNPEHLRYWFQTLRELYAQGANLGPLLDSMGQTLAREEERRLQGFLERLPTRVNVAGILFFFPAFFAVAVLPLVIEITGDF